MNAEWIPVTEKLPECGGEYIVTICTAHSNMSQEVTVAEYNGDKENPSWFFIAHTVGKKMKITAWMPLPDPYVDNLDRVCNLISVVKRINFTSGERRDILENALKTLDTEIKSLEKS